MPGIGKQVRINVSGASDDQLGSMELPDDGLHIGSFKVREP